MESLSKRTAIITGVQGQDGSYLSKLLLGKGYFVIGLERRKAQPANVTNFRLKDIIKHPKFLLVKGDVTDAGCINRLVSEYKPDEYYNLAAMSFVPESWNSPSTTMDINCGGVINALEAIRTFSPKTRFYQASSSEMFGDNPNYPYNENSYFSPRSPYGVSKVSAHYIVKVYRESYNTFACCGILFNHGSEFRGEEFVTKKIAKSVAEIKKGLRAKIILGNLDAKRDWGHAQDYVKGMFLMLQHKNPDDYVIATGEAHSVGEFVEKAFAVVGITNWKDYVDIGKEFIRPAEVSVLIGNAKKAEEVLKWRKDVSFDHLVERMVNFELEKLTNQKELS